MHSDSRFLPETQGEVGGPLAQSEASVALFPQGLLAEILPLGPWVHVVRNDPKQSLEIPASEWPKDSRVRHPRGVEETGGTGPLRRDDLNRLGSRAFPAPSRSPCFVVPFSIYARIPGLAPPPS